MSLRVSLGKTDNEPVIDDSYKKNWHVRDVFLAIIIWIVVGIPGSEIFKHVLFIHSYFIDLAADFFGKLLAIYLLNQKYSLQLFPKLNSQDILKYILPAIFLSLLFGGFPYFVYFGHLENLPKEYNLFKGFNAIGKFFLLFFIFLLGPIIEEIFYRGFIYRIIKNRYNIFCGVIISTGIFYVVHGIDRIGIITMSLIFTYVYQKTGNIWNSIIVHSLNNTLWFIFVYWGVKLKTGS